MMLTAGRQVADERADAVQVLADGLGVCGTRDRQDVLEQGGRHAEGDQRGPAGFQIQQLRRGVFGEQLGQRAEGLAVRWVAVTAVEAWTGEGDIAKHGAKDDWVLSFVAQLTAGQQRGRLTKAAAWAVTIWCCRHFCRDLLSPIDKPTASSRSSQDAG